MLQLLTVSFLVALAVHHAAGGAEEDALRKTIDDALKQYGDFKEQDWNQFVQSLRDLFNIKTTGKCVNGRGDFTFELGKAKFQAKNVKCACV